VEPEEVPYGGYSELSIEQWLKYAPFDHVITLEFAEMVALMDDPAYAGGDPTVSHPQSGSIS
jgi:hypothetical protein